MQSQAIPIKLVIIGDGTVGKTCILTSYTQNRFPTEYVPTVFDNSTTTLKVDGQIVNLGLWDTAGQEEFSRLRPLAYPNTQIFLITFSIAEKSTLTNAIKKWYPQVSKAAPTALIVFVGNKIDLRLSQYGKTQTITEQEVRQQLKGIDCLYHQCSALTRLGLKQTFENSVRQVLIRKKNEPTRKSVGQTVTNDTKCQCQIM